MVVQRACTSCGESVLYLRNDSTGNTAPIDLEPVADGNIVVDLEEGTYHVLRKDEGKPICPACTGAGVVNDEQCKRCGGLGERPRRKNHFATCPHAARHHKTKKGA